MNGSERMQTQVDQSGLVIDITRYAWQARLERWRNVARYRRSRGEIEDAAYRYARTLGEEVAVVSSRSPTLGRFAFWSGQVLGWGGLALAGLGILLQRRPDLDEIVFGPFGIGILGLIVSGPLSRWGSRLLRPSATEIRAADKRRPVLLLASFRTSDREILAGGASDLNNDTALEDAVGQPFLRYGPFAALRPAEQGGVRPGAFGEANWDAVAARQKDQAVLLVAMPAAGPALASEIDAIVRRRNAPKLLVLMPPLDGVWPWEGARAPVGNAAAERRRSVVEEALAWRPRSTTGAVWDRTKRRMRSVADTEEALRLARWSAMRDALKEVPGFAALPQVAPPRVIAVHLVRGGEPVILTGPKVPAGPDYIRAIAFAIYGMKCHGTS